MRPIRGEEVAAGLAVAAALALGGCLASGAGVPPVSAELLARVEPAGLDAAALQRGRDLYVGKCARCHTALPIDAYGAEAWPGILARMGPLTPLDGPEQQDLAAYVYAARALLAE